MDIIVHFPEAPEKQVEIHKLAAKIHAQYVAQYVQNLQCPTEQKLKLIDAVADTILQRSKDKTCQ